MIDETGTVEPTLDEILQALRARAGFEVLFPEGPRKEKIREFVSRLKGDFPDAYDYIAAGVYFESVRTLRERALAILNGGKGDLTFDWGRVLEHPVLHGLADLTVSMRGGKGRKEGVEISKTVPLEGRKSRWSWRKSDEP